MRKIGKRGDGTHYGIIFALILGLVIIAISVYFLFYEYFSEEDISKETCRQSIILRASLPQKDLALWTVSSKDWMPLRCKTEVININYKDVKKARTAFDNALLDCWSLVGNGDWKIFPVKSGSWGFKSHCIVCSRIHIDNQVRQYYTDNPIRFTDALSQKFKGKTYWDYLQKENPNAPAFLFLKGGAEEFKVLNEGENFSITYFQNKETADSADSGLQVTKTVQGPGLILPRGFDVNKGDLFIVVSSPSSEDKEVTPYMFFLQAKDFNEITKTMAEHLWIDVNTCDMIESVPA